MKEKEKEMDQDSGRDICDNDTSNINAFNNTSNEKEF